MPFLVAQSVRDTVEREQTPQTHSYSSVTLLPVSFLDFEKKKRHLNCLISHVVADKNKTLCRCCRGNVETVLAQVSENAARSCSGDG